MDIIELLLQIFLLALGFVLLIKGADWFVDSSSSVMAYFAVII
jgi:Ca2+/Na+ antiporter